MARIYRQLPLNSIWEGSGNVMCLDVLRAAAKHPRCREMLAAEIAPALGRDARLDRFVARLQDEWSGEATEVRGRSIAQGIALAVQGALLVRFSPDHVAGAFCASRLSGDLGFAGGAYGNLPAASDFAAILDRAGPR